MDVIIIGAGMAGLTAAQALVRQGHRVHVLDKAKGVGGRMATRRFEEAVFDHGAQFFTARSPEFAELIAAHTAAVTVWTDGIPNERGAVPRDLVYPRYRGVRGMTDLPKAMAAGLDCRLSYTVSQIKRGVNCWEVHGGEDQPVLTADAVIVTAPVPQSLVLARDCGVSDALIKQLRRMVYAPCFAVLAVLPEPSLVPEPGAVRLDHEVLSFVADNQRKGISQVPAVTLHSNAAFARKYFDASLHQVAQLMLDAAAAYLPHPPVEHIVHRWRYASPEGDAPALYAAVDELVFAGDAFAGGRVEGASRSGLAAAEYLIGRN